LCALGFICSEKVFFDLKCAKLFQSACGFLGAKQKMTAAGKLDEMIEGSLEVKLPTIWTDEKQSRAEAERRERLEERRVEEKE
jgi:hypothetical protein